MLTRRETRFGCASKSSSRTVVYFRVFRCYRAMPLLLSFVLIALFLWIAEDVATFANVLRYPHHQQAWHAVHMDKLGSWLLLMIVSYILITQVHTP